MKNFIASLAITILTSPLAAATITVTPTESIQAAINTADPGDVISISEGTYHESLSITTDGLTLHGNGTVNVMAVPHDALTGDSALTITGASKILIEDINFTTPSGGIQVDESNHRTIGYYSRDAISVVNSDALLRRVTAQPGGALTSVDGTPAAGLGTTDSYVTMENSTLSGCTGTPRIGNDYTANPVRPTVGGAGLRASGGRIVVENSILQGGNGGAGLSSRYGSASMSGGPAALLLAEAQFELKSNSLRAGDTPEPGFWTVGYGTAGAAAPVVRSSGGALGNLTDNSYDTSRSYVRGETPFVLVATEGSNEEVASDSVIAGSETRRFAEVATLLAARTSLNSLEGADGIIDAADLLSSGEVALPFPWWQ